MRATGAPAVLVLLAVAAAPALGQTPPPAGEERPGWSASAALYGYFMPDAADFLLPIVSADCDRLHLEARYNYEAPDTGSLWIGANYSGGGELAWELTPLVGVVIGDTHGIAPGYKGSLGWKGFELYSEGEYVLDTEDSSASFFYNWSELTYAPAEWFRFGLATQRIRAHASERDVQRGLLVGLATGRTSLTAYVLNPDDDPTVILAVAIDF